MKRISYVRRCAVRLVQGAACLAVLGCQSAADEPAARTAPAAEPERFNFVVPNDYVKTELRGEGSESLRAPPDARVTRDGDRFALESGSDFSIEVLSGAPPLADFGAGVAPVFREADLLIFKSGSGYSFVLVRELVPEWDEAERQRLACGSAGGAVRPGVTRADGGGYSKAAVEAMVAACRSLELPKLE